MLCTEVSAHGTAGYESYSALTVAPERSRSPHSWLMEGWSDRINDCDQSTTQLDYSLIFKKACLCDAQRRQRVTTYRVTGALSNTIMSE